MAINAKLLTALALAAVVGSGMVSAGSVGTIVLNDKSFPLNSFTVTTDGAGKLVVRASYGATGDTGGSSPPPPVVEEPVVEEPVVEGPVVEGPVDRACGPTPSNVAEMSELQWGRSTSSTRYALSSETKAFPFTSSSGGRLEGRLETAYTSSNPRTRSTWISKCPGGAPLDQQFRGYSVCVNEAYEVTNIGWSEPGNSRICSLEPGTRYYFNVRSSDTVDASRSNCGSSTNCGFYMRNTTY